MQDQRLTYLLERYLADAATTQELQELSELLKADADSELFKKILAEMMQRERPAFPANQEPWEKMAQHIVNMDQRGVAQAGRSSAAEKSSAAGRSFAAERPVAPVFPLRRWIPAAAVVVLFSMGTYLWLAHKQQPSLAAAGTVPHDTVISTARGEQREVLLPDGSHLWLNSASSVRYPISFAGGERSVELSGEAFFDIQHADKAPFLIHSGGITTIVLGTSFDITAYPFQEHMTVAVQSGKVKVQTGSKTLAILEKGNQVRVTADTTALQKIVDPSSIAAWRNGDLTYKDERVEDIVADLQRNFNDSVEIKTPELKKVMITISFNKNIGVQNALEMICRTTESRLTHRLTHEHSIFTIE